MRLFTGPKQTSEERRRCLAYHDAQLRVAAFLGKERSLLDGTLGEHWDAMTKDPLAAREVCRASDRFRQAAEEAVCRYAAIQLVPAAASKFHRAESAHFLAVSAWAKANLAVMETLAKGKPPFYVPVERRREEAESARQRAQETYRSFRRRLGLAAEGVDLPKAAISTCDLEEANIDTWQPQSYAHDFSEAVQKIIEPQEDGLKATANTMAHTPAVGTNPCMNANTARPIDPTDAAAWYNEGCGLTALGRHEEAVSCYDKAIEIDPQEV